MVGHISAYRRRRRRLRQTCRISQQFDTRSRSLCRTNRFQDHDHLRASRDHLCGGGRVRTRAARSDQPARDPWDRPALRQRLLGRDGARLHLRAIPGR
ncbi:hypothetical protein XH80_02855 [Bradyrhizobium sp. CCBAU 45384]|nr:hypothetical protein [Bradyrhizobium sp. CCBAU 45384]